MDLYTPKGDAIKILSGTPPNGFILTAATLAITDAVRIVWIYFFTEISRFSTDVHERYKPIARPQVVPIGPQFDVNLSK